MTDPDIVDSATLASVDGPRLSFERLVATDTTSLVRFYNGLSLATIRLFRPLGLRTSLEVCQRIATMNGLSPALRMDWVVRRIGETEIVGWAFLERLTTDHPAMGIAVADRMQGQGIGSALLARVMMGARQHGLKSVCLTVVQSNERAIALYKRFGFETYGEEFDEADQLRYFRMICAL